MTREHRHEFETDDIVLEDNAAIVHQSCRYQPTKTQTAKGREIQAPTGPQCEEQRYERKDVKWVETPGGTKHDIKSFNQIRGPVEQCIMKVEEAWRNSELDKLHYHDHFEQPPEEIEATEGGCTVHYEGSIN